jgi:hypothetical protein
VCVYSDKKTALALTLCTYYKLSKGFSGQFSFSIRGFPATVKVAVRLVTLSLLHPLGFLLPPDDKLATSWTVLCRPEKALQPGEGIATGFQALLMERLEGH